MLTDLEQKLSAIRRGELDERTVYASSFAERRQLVPAEGPVFHCPVCGTWHRRFLPFGLGGRRNAKCPACGSLERHRYLWRHLRDHHRVERRRLAVLHVAPEPCIAARLSGLANLRYLTMDLYNEGAALNRDLTDTGLPAAVFDMVICSHVLEHIERDDLAIAEMARLLRPGGRLVAMVPVDRKLTVTFEDASITDPLDRHIAFGHPYHVRVCGMDYPDRIRAAGFNVTVFDSRRMSPLIRHVERINKTLLFDGIKRRA
ncbi:MAG: methyltransferase domain-containing protein [Rhodospirillales bacterium]